MVVSFPVKSKKAADRESFPIKAIKPAAVLSSDLYTLFQSPFKYLS